MLRKQLLINRKWTIIFLMTFFVLSLSSQIVQSQNIESLLFEQLINEEESSIGDQVTAALLMSEMVLSEEMFEQLIDVNAKESNLTNGFLQSFLLARQTQEFKYINQFINAYPEGEDLTSFHKEMENASYKFASSPFQESLIRYASSSDKALKKIIRSLKVLDGANADSGQDFINELYERTPKRVQKIFKEEKVILKDYLYIEEELIEEIEEANQIIIEVKDSLENPNIGKSGKPTSKEVIYLFMQNYDVLLSEGKYCEGMGTEIEDQTIGEYVCGFLAYHDPSYDNETPFKYQSTPKGNYLDIKVKEGTELREKHWKVTFQVGHYELESNNIWKQGVSFLILDKDWQVLRNSFTCIGAG